jgi:type VI secretion system secreted protein VgrG
MSAIPFNAFYKTEAFEAEMVVGFRVVNRAGVPAEAWVDCHFADANDPEEMIGTNSELSFGHEGEDPVVFEGLVESVSVVGMPEAEGTIGYRIHVVSSLALLAREVTCEIFQEMDVKAIVSKVLDQNAIPSDMQEWKLTGSYLKRAYCVQYNESALAFVTRLCEDEGIYFFYEKAGEGKPKIVFADDSTAAAPLLGGDEIMFNPHAGMDERKDVISNVTDRRRVVAGTVVLRDFNFEKPKLDLTAKAEADVDKDLEVYDYPGGYFEKAEGDRRAKMRLQAEQSERTTFSLEGECARVAAGRKLKLVDAGDIGADGSYFVVSVLHEYRHGDKESAGGGEIYRTHAEVLPVAVPFRLPVLTPRPVVHGPQTAVVVAPSGSPAEEIHTDEHGRAKVKFNWDIAAPVDDKASCWMRVAQLQTSGSMILPRIGWEVIIEFLEGDPDRPIVTGRLYNGLYMPPYQLPQGKTRTSIQTASTPGGGGTNEIRLEDKAGGEEIMVHSQYDTTIKVANNKTKNVGNNETSSIGVDHTLKVGAEQEVKISMGHQHSVDGDQTLTVAANRNVSVNAVAGLTTGGAESVTVGASQMEMVGNPLEGLISVAISKAAEIAAEKAAEALEGVTEHVMGKVNQVMAPVNALTAKAQQLGGGMAALASGNLAAAGGLMAAAGGSGGFAGALSGGGLPGFGGLAATTKAGPGGKGSSAAGISAGLFLTQKMGGAIEKGVGKVAKAFEGEGADAEGGGGESEANKAGPEGKVGGINESDKEKGPGHNHTKVGASITETVGAVKIVAAIDGVMTNAAASMTQNIGAAKASIVVKDYAASVEGLKSETEVGLVVVTKGDETETVGAAKSQMVGGAILEKIAGGHTIVAGGPATMIGAFHKWEAKTKLTLKCGGSTIVIDGSGVTIQSTLIMVTAGKIQLPKATTEV